jgi:putative sterol carrier protein
VARYLSLDWIDALSAEVAASAELRQLASTTAIGVTQVVTNGPEGDVVYHLQLGNGSASFGAGPAHPEDVRFDEDWDTAVAVATGELNAQEAFIKGTIRLTGDHATLLANERVFAALDAVFSAVQPATTYE